MIREKTNLQESFLNHMRREKISVTIFLVNGVKLQGVITWFDNFSLLLNLNSQSQLVYKHAISTIMPAQHVTLYSKGEGAAGAADDAAESESSTNTSESAESPAEETPAETPVKAPAKKTPVKVETRAAKVIKKPTPASESTTPTDET